MSSWLEVVKEHLYLCIARIGDQPTGVCIPYMKDNIGLLADAATLPDFLVKGCHTAMINQRIDQATKRDCYLMTSFVEFGSSIHRNLERAGLRVACKKSIWWLVKQNLTGASQLELLALLTPELNELPCCGILSFKR